jgi:hypothetical protein
MLFLDFKKKMEGQQDEPSIPNMAYAQIFEQARKIMY